MLLIGRGLGGGGGGGGLLVDGGFSGRLVSGGRLVTGGGLEHHKGNT